LPELVIKRHFVQTGQLFLKFYTEHLPFDRFLRPHRSRGRCAAHCSSLSEKRRLYSLDAPATIALSHASTGSDMHTNQLIHESSPYLLQHAHNPVNWYPWGPEA